MGQLRSKLEDNPADPKRLLTERASATDWRSPRRETGTYALLTPFGAQSSPPKPPGSDH